MPTQATLPGGGQRITVDVALKQPRIIARAIGDLALDRFLADRLLTTGGSDQIAGGAAVFGRNESRYPDDDPKKIPPRSEYPRTGWTTELFTEQVHKYGLEVPITDEARRRNAMDEVARGQRKLTNAVVRFVDGYLMEKIYEDGDIGHYTALGDWAATPENIIPDIAGARADILNLDEGYVPDTLVIHPDEELAMMLAEDIRNALPRESGQNAIITGTPVPILGLRQILVSNRVHSGFPLLTEGGTLGTIADESPLPDEGYQSNSPGAGQPTVYVKVYREDGTDESIVRAARFPAVWITDPASATIFDNVGPQT